MADIKSFLLKALGFVFLLMALTALFVSFTLYFLEGELKTLQSTIITALAPIAAQSMNTDEAGFSSIDFDQIAAYCLSDPEMQMLSSTQGQSTDLIPKDTCQLVNAGAINDTAGLSEHVSGYALKSGTDSALSSIAPQLEFLRTVQLLLFFAFILLLLFSTVSIYLFDSSTFFGRFFFYSGIISVLSLISLGIVWLSAPAIANGLSQSLASQPNFSQEMVSAAKSIISPLTLWAQDYVMKPLLLAVAISIISIAGWLVGNRKK
ncbi:MAG: hypothetical protein WCT31_02960 [Candidatus Micrarchaeia archaeon]